MLHSKYLFTAQLEWKGEKKNYNQINLKKKISFWKLVEFLDFIVAKKNITSYFYKKYLRAVRVCLYRVVCQWRTAGDLPETCCWEFPAKYTSYLQQVSRGFRLYIIDGPHCTYLLQ